MQKGFCPAGNHQTKTEQIQRKKWNEEMWKNEKILLQLSNMRHSWATLWQTLGKITEEWNERKIWTCVCFHANCNWKVTLDSNLQKKEKENLNSPCW